MFQEFWVFTHTYDPIHQTQPDLFSVAANNTVNSEKNKHISLIIPHHFGLSHTQTLHLSMFLEQNNILGEKK